MLLRLTLVALALFVPVSLEAQWRCFYVRAWSNSGSFNEGGGVAWVSNAQCVNETLSINDADVKTDFGDLLARELGYDYVSGRVSTSLFVDVAASRDEAERKRRAYVSGLRDVEVRDVGYAYIGRGEGQPFFPGTPASQVCFYARAVHVFNDAASQQSIKRAYVSNVQCSDRLVFSSTVMLQFTPWLASTDRRMVGGSSSAWVYTTPERAERERTAQAGRWARDGYDVRTASFTLDDAGIAPLAPLLTGATESGSRTSSGSTSSRQRVYRIDPVICYAMIWTNESTGFVIPPKCYNGTASPSEQGLRTQLSDWARLGEYGWVVSQISSAPMQLIVSRDQSSAMAVVRARYDSTFASLNGPSRVYTPTGFNYNPYIVRRTDDAQRIAAMEQDEQIVGFLGWLFSPFDWLEISAELGVVDMERAMTSTAGIRFRPYFDRTRIHLYANLDKDNAVPTTSGEQINNWQSIRGAEFLLGFAENHVWLAAGAAQLTYNVRTGNGLFWNTSPGGEMTEITAGIHFDFNSTFGVWTRYGTETQFAIGGRLGFGETGIRRMGR